MLQALTMPQQTPLFNGESIEWDEASQTKELFEVPDDCHLIAVMGYIPPGQEFDGNAAPTLKVGTAADDDGFFTNTEIALGTAGLKIWRPQADNVDTTTTIAAPTAANIVTAGGNTYSDAAYNTELDIVVADLKAKAQTAIQAVETEVNQLKAMLRSFGAMGTATGFNRTTGVITTASTTVKGVWVKGDSAVAAPTKGKILIWGVYLGLYQLNRIGMKV